MSGGFGKLILDGIEIVPDDATASNHCYLVGPQAIANLQHAGVLEQWIEDGTLQFVEIVARTD